MLKEIGIDLYANVHRCIGHNRETLPERCEEPASMKTTEKMQRTILVTGAHGFLGRHLSRILARRGDRVVGLGHGTWERQEWKLWGLEEWHSSDITVEALEGCSVSPHAIIHCAGSGSVQVSLSEPGIDMQRTVVTTSAVLEFIRTRRPATRLVYPSSAGVYGIAEHLPISEDAPVAPISPYGTHKRMAEELISSYAASFDVRCAVVRLFSIFGAGLRKQFLWDACRKLMKRDLVFMGTGNEVRDWLHVDDAAALLSVAIDRAGLDCPVVNGGTGTGISVRELLNYLAQILQLEGPQPQFNGVVRKGDPPCYIADIRKAASWGWRPVVDWTERLREYAIWWQKDTGLRIIVSPSKRNAEIIQDGGTE